MQTIISESVGFNPAPATEMMLDINSCFATIEQQANPLLRGKPVVVGAYTTDRGCVLAASREAKKLGVKTGMMVGDAKRLCGKDLKILFPDPNKYRYINKKLVTLLSRFTDPIEVKSIDEMTFSFKHSYLVERKCRQGLSINDAMWQIATDIKHAVKKEIGDWMTVSIGIAPNRYLAKIASNLQKPDGLVRIDKENIKSTLETMELEELTGIKHGMGTRLRAFGITTPMRMYHAKIQLLKAACQSIVGYHWWLRLHGWEADDREFSRKSIGHSYALRKPLLPTEDALKHILYQLIVKMGRRVRTDHLTAQGLYLSCSYRDGSFWRLSEKQSEQLYTDQQFFSVALRLLTQAPNLPLRVIAVSSFNLKEDLYAQQCLFTDRLKERAVTQALDTIAERWGDWTVVPGRLLSIDQKVHDRIAFASKHTINYAMRGVEGS